MTITATENQRGVEGNLRRWLGTITFDSSYPTGGEAIAASDFGLAQIEHVQLATGVGALDITPHWDQTNSKIILAVSSTGLQVANTTDMSATTVIATVHGK